MSKILSDKHRWVEGPDDTTVCKRCGVGYFTRIMQLTYWKEMTRDRCKPKRKHFKERSAL